VTAEPTVAIPLILRFLPVTSSYTKSPVTLRLPATSTSLLNVPIPVTLIPSVKQENYLVFFLLNY